VGALPVTEESAASVLSLPMYPELTNEEVGRVIEEIMQWAANREALSRQAV
jgi:dTDP-4-amino-4,6-dideoxygalactose transaminase